MHQSEIAGLMKALAPIVGDFVTKAVAPLRAENQALHGRLNEIDRRFAGVPSKEESSVLILRLVEETVAKLPPPEPGKDADPELVAALVDKAVAALPPAKDGEPGTSVTVEDLAPLVAEEVAKAVSEIQLPSIDWSEVGKMIGDKVGDSVAAIPPAVPGKDADLAQIAAMVATEVERAVEELPAAKDGVGLAGALIDREGCLVVTLTDGSTKTLGAVVGKDVDIEYVAEMVRGEVAKIPVPKDGVDGVGFDDMDLVEVDGDLLLRFTKGEAVREFIVPVPLDHGVWTEREYKQGSGVTWGGSWWIAQRSTTAKPDTPDSGWRLAVKRGREGKEGKPGPAGERGYKGDPGTAGRNSV